MKDKHTHSEKMARNGRTKVIYKGTFISDRSLSNYGDMNVGGFHSIWVGNLWVKYPLDGSTLVIPSRCSLISFFIPVDVRGSAHS